MDLNDTQIQVGPVADGTYRYRIGQYISKASYHNSASAWSDARRPQELDEHNQLTPDAIAEGLTGASVYRNYPPYLS